MLSISKASKMYRSASGEDAHEIVQIDPHTVQIETSIAGDDDVGFGFVSLFLQESDNGFSIFDDEQYARTARRCDLRPKLPEGIRQHETVLVVQTGSAEQDLTVGLKLFLATLRGVHEPGEKNAKPVVLLPMKKNRTEEKAVCKAVV